MSEKIYFSSCFHSHLSFVLTGSPEPGALFFTFFPPIHQTTLLDFGTMISAGSSFKLLFSLGLVASTSAAPALLSSRALSAADMLANGQQAQQQNAQFASMTANSTCTGEFIEFAESHQLTKLQKDSKDVWALPSLNA